VPWSYKPRTGGKAIPPNVQERTRQRILKYANQHYPGKFTRVDVRFRGAHCYIDVYQEANMPPGMKPPPGETRAGWIEQLNNTPYHLCRIRYSGNEDRWSFAHYTYAHEKYEPSFLVTGSFQGTPEEAFQTSALFF